jgi:hypothetical protein
MLNNDQELRYEERLTMLITAIFDALEQDDPVLFNCGDINLRTAMERFYYFNGMLRPQSLKPLLVAGRKWREQSVVCDLTDLYDDLLGKIEKAGGSQRVRQLARWFYSIGSQWLLKLSTVVSFLRVEKVTDAKTPPIAFYAFSDRFVYFFKDVIANLDDQDCIFLSGNGLVKPAVVEEVGARVCLAKSGRLPACHWMMGVRHSLFIDFTVVLKILARNYQILRQHCPSVVVFAEGTSVEDQAIALAAKALNIPTLRLQSGRAGILHSGYRGMCFDKMLCWGRGFVERFKSCSPDPQYVITGNPVLDGFDRGASATADRPSCLAVFSQPVTTGGISDDDYEVLVSVVEEFIKQNNKIRVVVRKHPADKSLAFDQLIPRYPDQLCMMNIETHGLSEVLQRCSVALGFYSTTLSEAVAAGVVPVILQLHGAHSVFPYPERHAAAIVTEAPEEALSCLLKLFHTPGALDGMRGNMRDFSEEFFGPQDGMSMQRIVDCIMEASKRVNEIK